MKIKNRLATTLFGLAVTAMLSTGAMADNGPNEALVVQYSTGTEEVFFLNEQPRITYAPTSINIQTTSVSVDRDLSTLARFSFQKRVPNSVDRLENRQLTFSFTDGHTVSCTGLKPGSTVTLHNIEGTVVLTDTADGEGHFSTDIDTLATGVYILSTTESRTYKIYKK